MHTTTRRRILYGGLAMTTASTLVLELALTRLFSVVMYYHFAFLAISLALFGLGAAGIYLYLRPLSGDVETLSRSLQRYAIAAALATIACVLIVVKQRIGLNLSALTVLRLSAIYVVAAVPFFFAGLIVTALIAQFRSDMGRLYFWDLAGAGVGCLALTVLLSWLGGINVALFCGGLFSIAGVLFRLGGGLRSKMRVRSSAHVAVATLAFGLTMVNTCAPIVRLRSVKQTRESRVVYAKWNSFSRVTVERTAGDHYWLRMDSSAATRIFSKAVAAKGFEPTRRFSEIRVAALVYALKKPGQALIIGPGGGADVISAIYHGVKDIVGVELNPIIARDVMKGRFADYSGNLYKRRGVRIVVGEGRSFIRSSEKRYSSIQATLVDTWAATAAGAFTLSENTLYTRDAFVDYLRHLKPSGVLSMTRWTNEPPREFLRLIVVARAALDDMGASDHQRHIYVGANRRMATLLVKRTPFTRKEIRLLHRYVREAKLKCLYAPDGKRHRNAYAELIGTKNWRSYVAGQVQDISPPTDDRPFFFYTVKPRRLLTVFANVGELTNDNLGLLMLLVLLVVVVVLVVLCLVLPLAWFRRSQLRGDRWGKTRYLSYFLAVGVGFITIEMALMQKFILFLGHPTYAIVGVLFSLLMSGGVGALLCRDVSQPRIRWLILRNVGLLIALVLTYVLVLGPLFGALVGAALAVRFSATALLIAPLGLVMGSLVPLGVQGAGARFGGVVAWAWGLNGAASVLGTVLATALAMNIGFNLTLAIGALCYGVGAVSIRRPLSGVDREDGSDGRAGCPSIKV